jgi:hypothetical protein
MPRLTMRLLLESRPGCHRGVMANDSPKSAAIVIGLFALTVRIWHVRPLCDGEFKEVALVRGNTANQFLFLIMICS